MNDQNLSSSSKIEQFSPLLSVFLNELQDKSPEILEKIQKKINSVNPSLFRKKNIQECIHQINTNFDSLSKVSRYFLFLIYS